VTGRRLRRLVDDLVAAGDLAPEWVGAFLAVPRHEFIPEVVWRHDPPSEDLLPVRRADDPEAWLDLAYANDALATQVDDGHPGPGLVGREATSSASQPSVVALMLRALEAEPGMRVCEIGTGTGYNAALLAHRLGATNVTSIEVDPWLAERAAGTLRRTGAGEVTVITGDGTLGYPGRAPYDRLVATAAVYEVPYAWIEQTRPGGRVLAPWRTDFYNGGLLSLTRHEDGTAVGGIIGNVAFMPLRAQRHPRAATTDIVRDGEPAATGSTTVHPYRLIRDPQACLAIALRVPRCHTVSSHPENGAFTTWFLDQWTHSWASVHYTPHAPHHPVRQHGPRRLWDEIHTAYESWQSAGRPSYRFTITPTATHITPAPPPAPLPS
jgi:protein-L-isoaspartate(D-aspartate) O-methyltransferase